MRRKVYTIIISPSNLKPAKQFTIHRSTLWFVIFIFLILITYGILGSIKFYDDNKIYAEYIQVKKEKGELEQANKSIAQLRKKENLIRKFLGLDADDANEPGQGGPGSTSFVFEDFHLNKKVSPAPARSLNLEKEAFLSPSYKEAILLDCDLQELIDFLKNQRDELATLPTIAPISVLESWITCGFGMRKSPFTGLREFHSGLDIFAMRGTPVIAPGNGRVCFVGTNGGLGQMITLRHNNQYQTVYGHLSGYNVKVNQVVKRGDCIGFVGRTGNSTGYHLHYEIHKQGKVVDPFPYLLNWDDRHFLVANNNLSLE
jgi:murein DD-endopeptidase MepM/ murein hydrolase activator NlpD